MLIFDIEDKRNIEYTDEFQMDNDKDYFFVCNTSEILNIHKLFLFEPETLVDCMNFDENIRFNNFSDYDFISMVYLVYEKPEVMLSEINIYVGKNYVVLVLMEQDKYLATFKDRLLNRVSELVSDKNTLNKIYYVVFDIFLYDIAESMEKMEDEINFIEIELVEGKEKNSRNKEIFKIRQNIYLSKKLLRPLLYVGDQLLIDENNIIKKANMRYFKNIDIRMNKLYDFSVNLSDFGNQLLNTFENTTNTKTNEVINKLTVITLFFAPLTLITGIYGMNFLHMPLLERENAYYAILVVMFIITIIIYIFLKKKKWL